MYFYFVLINRPAWGTREETRAGKINRKGVRTIKAVVAGDTAILQKDIHNSFNVETEIVLSI
jgi:hypothetical protein